MIYNSNAISRDMKRFNVTRQQPQLLCPKWCNLAKWNQQWVDQCSTVQKIQMHINHVLKRQNIWLQNIVTRWTDQYPSNKSLQELLELNSPILSLPFCCAWREACKQHVGMGWSWHQFWWSFSTRWNREPPCQSLSGRICFLFWFNVLSDTSRVKLIWKFLPENVLTNIEVVAY